ncbi:MAG: antibiotic resistance protein MarC [Bacteroidetes bacterium CG2_30_33_31]|nr:MAG: antibiotic resistance protein MarC [Bacteroidetes bacterium CG2_30_33_31]
MDEVFSFGLYAFTGFLAMINPMGVTPVFLTLTADLTQKQKQKTAITAVFTAFVVLTIFAFGGQLLFKFFGISVDSFRVAGGIIFFIMGFDMLNAKVSRLKYKSKDIDEQMNDVAVTPLGIPMIAGPGSITNAIVLMNDAHSTGQKIVLPIAIILVLTFTLISMIAGTKIMKFLGKTGNRVMLKLMGLIMMVIAVEFFFAGLKPILRNILLK